MSWFVLDAFDEQSAKAETISERIAAAEKAIVTAFWPHEVLNALLVGERRKRLSSELTDAFLQDLERLAVEVDISPPTMNVFDTVQALCRKHRLTSYDAAYLELAMRGGHPLATVDNDLAKAARQEGIELL